MAKGLLEEAVPIYVCPTYPQALGKSADDLIPGVQPAGKSAFFNFSKGWIVTLEQ